MVSMLSRRFEPLGNTRLDVTKMKHDMDNLNDVLRAWAD